MLLDWTGPITAGQLAEHLGLTTGAVSGILDRLAGSGWVSRQRDPADKRKVIVHLVENRGQDVALLFGGMRRAVDRIVAELTDDQLAAVVHTMKLLSDAFYTETVRLRAETRAGLPIGGLATG